jgi:transcriptional regulator with XRE-family HTH domain
MRRHPTPITGAQLRAARGLVGLRQRELGALIGYTDRAIRSWEARGNGLVPAVPVTLDALLAVLADRGVVFFSEPTPGVRLSK